MRSIVKRSKCLPRDLALRVARVAGKLADSLAEFGDDVSASAEWIQALGDAEHALDRALGLADEWITAEAAPPISMVSSTADRELARFNPDGTWTIASNLTPDESKQLIRHLAGEAAQRYWYHQEAETRERAIWRWGADGREALGYVVEALDEFMLGCDDECVCEDCRECDRPPSDCSGTACASSCSCSSCRFCMGRSALEGAGVVLADHSKPQSGSAEILAADNESTAGLMAE